MNRYLGAVILSTFSLVSSVIIALFLLHDSSMISYLVFLGVFLYGLIGIFAYNREAKEYFLNNHKSMYKERENVRILNHLEVVYMFWLAGIGNIFLYIVLLMISF